MAQAGDRLQRAAEAGERYTRIDDFDGDRPSTDNVAEPMPRRAQRRADTPVSSPPGGDESDGDLLIFARRPLRVVHRRDADSDGARRSAPRSAGQSRRLGLARRRAGRAARSSATRPRTGLPRRVPQAEPGPRLPAQRRRRAIPPAHNVRDPPRIAAHTTGYFRGWRRGQEVGGFSVGGRPGREAAGGWDFSREREASRDYQEREFEYRSARR